ncbi:MAG: glucose 1-dehydrogenase [Ilumatobacteraceae bacterium]
MIPDHTERPLADLVSLSGRRAVVTGAASGIGRAIAHRLAEAGAAVVIADLDGDGAAKVAAEVAATTGARAIGVEVDVTDSTTLASAAERAHLDLGGLEIWVNCAGIDPTTGPAIEATDEFIDRMLTVNVRGTFAGAREAAKRMDHGGVIVNLISTAGFRAATGISAYVASKHALVGLTKNLAVELAARDIRVVGVAPGVIDTPGVQAQLAPLAAAGLNVAATMNRTLLGRGGQPDDVARVVLFLASDLAAWITGEIVVADAGSLAG